MKNLDVNTFFTKNYDEIILMSQKICKGSIESEEVAHFAMSEFIEHERLQELIDAGKAMAFISGIIWRSFNSSTSRYHTIYRQKNRVGYLPTDYDHGVVEPYNINEDEVVLAIQGILEDMAADMEYLWYRAQLFQMWLETPNYSELSRITDIPRTSISQAVEEAKVYIREELIKRGITYEL